MKILVAEDDPITGRLIQRFLERWNHEVIMAGDGEAAWKIFQQENVKLVIADWMMPLLDGIELCRRIRARKGPGYVYFILLTSRDSKEDLIAGLDAGADDYIVKPFAQEELRVRLRAGERILDLERELTAKNNELLQLNIRLEELVCIDHLMEIGNRRSFYSSIEKMYHRACRYGQNFGVIMCDVDNFKAYNDRYGHLAGDRILKAVAAEIQRSLRTSDEVFRYGGEEIIILLPDQGLEGSMIVAERTRKNIEALGIEHNASVHSIVTISCGVTAFLNECDETTQKWNELVDRADKALYRAKAEGRNRVAAWTAAKPA